MSQQVHFDIEVASLLCHTNRDLEVRAASAGRRVQRESLDGERAKPADRVIALELCLT